MRRSALEQEIAEYRTLMEQPSEYEEGFDVKTVIGAFFVGFVMMPGAIYLSLVAGQSLGPAAQWTTIILFTEVARRSFMTLKRQEVYVLFYVAGGLASGGAFGGFIWSQYLVQSPAAKTFEIQDQIPTWVVPHADSPALLERTFLNRDWLVPIGLMFLGSILGKLNWFGMGYLMFRITSDLERLPFPFAPISAQGATALAETTSKTETWRWQVFSIGSMVGIVFGAFYVGIPALTARLLSKPIQLIPIPFIELTRNTESILPATPTGLATDIGNVFTGFILPFWVIVGSAIAGISTLVINPVLYHTGHMPTWQRGMDTINTAFATGVDFWTSFGIGTGVAVFVLGTGNVIASLRRARDERKERGDVGSLKPPPGRGDLSLWWAFGMWFFATAAYVWLCRVLVPRFPIWVVIAYGFGLSAGESYINARLIGLVGEGISIPFVKEATFIWLVKYRGVDIWFAPIPLSNQGGTAASFRAVELTGTKITSIIKAELLMYPFLTFCSFLFWQFMWRLNPIPSAAYPFVQKMWPLQALQQCLWFTSTNPGSAARELFFKMLKPWVMGVGFGSAVLGYLALVAFRQPLMLVYGVIRGFGRWPHYIPGELLGACLSRFYFEKRLGRMTWRRYATVLMAGFSCGMGLVGMGSVAITMVLSAVSPLPY